MKRKGSPKECTSSATCVKWLRERIALGAAAAPPSRRRNLGDRYGGRQAQYRGSRRESCRACHHEKTHALFATHLAVCGQRIGTGERRTQTRNKRHRGAENSCRAGRSKAPRKEGKKKWEKTGRRLLLGVRRREEWQTENASIAPRRVTTQEGVCADTSLKQHLQPPSPSSQRGGRKNSRRPRRGTHCGVEVCSRDATRRSPPHGPQGARKNAESRAPSFISHEEMEEGRRAAPTA